MCLGIEAVFVRVIGREGKGLEGLGDLAQSVHADFVFLECQRDVQVALGITLHGANDVGGVIQVTRQDDALIELVARQLPALLLAVLQVRLDAVYTTGNPNQHRARRP